MRSRLLVLVLAAACGSHGGNLGDGPTGLDTTPSPDTTGDTGVVPDSGGDATVAGDAMGDAAGDATVVHDASPDAFVIHDAPHDAFVIHDAPPDAFVVHDAPPDAFVAHDAPPDAFVVHDAPHDAFVVHDAPPDAFVVHDAPPDAFVVHDAFVMHDAAPDAGGARGTVNVQVTNIAGALCVTPLHVVFVDTDNTTSDVLADASGNASASVYAGASVTAICHRSTGTYTMTTIQAIAPGDNLVLNAAAFLTGRQTADTTAAGTFTITYPTYSGAAGYTIYHPCAPAGGTFSSGTSKALTMQVGCALTTMDIVVIANNNMGAALGYTEQANITFTSGGSATMTDTWHAMPSVTATYSNAPAFCANSGDPSYPCNVQLDRYVPDLRGMRSTANGNIAASSVILTETTPHAATASMQTIFSTSGSPPVYQIITEVISGTAATYTLDIAANLLPWLCLGNSPLCPIFSDVNASLTVPVTGTGAIDLFEADAQYTRNATQIYVWHVFGPTPGDVHFPVIPVAAGDVTPKANDKQAVTHAYACESTAIAGYAAARVNVYDSLETCLASPSSTAKRYPGTINRVSRTP